MSHAEAIQTNDKLELIALCDTDEKKLSWASETYGVKDCYSDYKAMIRQCKPDILSIATRTSGRTEIIEFAAVHGVKGVHVEKPISNNMEDCRRALNSVVNNNVRITYGTIRRFMDVYRKARDMILAGEIGDLIEVCIEHGRTTVMWNHPHSVDLLVFFSRCVNVDYIQSTCTVDLCSVRKNVVDDDPVVECALVKFGNGVNGVITSGSGLNTRISGSSGKITVCADGSWIEVDKKASAGSSYERLTDKFEVVPEMSGRQRAYCELERAVRGNKDGSPSVEEIMVSQKILLGFVLSSLEGGTRLPLSSVDYGFTVTGRFGSLYA